METALLPVSRFQVDQAGEDLVLRRRTGSVRCGVFLLPWVALWTLACVGLIRQMCADLTLEHALIAAPFLAGWVAASLVIGEMLFGFERVRIGPDGCELRTLFQRRLVPLVFGFLAPFALVGLGLFSYGLQVLSEPFTVERWGIGPSEISARTTRFGHGRTRRVPVEDLSRVELRRGPANPDLEIDTPYSLCFVGRDASNLIVVEGLTEGEARWAGAEVSEVLKGKLPGDGGSASLRDRELGE